MAPNPRRRTVRSPPISIVVTAWLPVERFATVAPFAGEDRSRTTNDETGVTISHRGRRSASQIHRTPAAVRSEGLDLIGAGHTRGEPHESGDGTGPPDQDRPRHRADLPRRASRGCPGPWQRSRRDRRALPGVRAAREALRAPA